MFSVFKQAHAPRPSVLSGSSVQTSQPEPLILIGRRAQTTPLKSTS
jgi:hypothetical protein